MSRVSNIISEFIKIWADQHELYSKQCIVTAVDKANRTCTCSPTDGDADVLKVYLEADYDEEQTSEPKGFFVVPELNSLVIVSFLDRDNAFISAWTDIESVVFKTDSFQFNDGALGGMVKVEAMTDRIKELEALIKTLHDDFAAWSPVANDGGLALKTKLLSSFLTKTVPNSQRADFENEKVKH